MGDAPDLQAEEVLDLAPDHERDVRREDEQRERHGEEPEPREGSLLLPLLPDTAAGLVEPIPALDRDRIGERRLLRGIGPPGRLSHARHSIKLR
jgi:hypothetical protein